VRVEFTNAPFWSKTIFFVEAKSTRSHRYNFFDSTQKKKQFEWLEAKSKELCIPAFYWVSRVVRHKRVVDLVSLEDARNRRVLK